MIKEAEEQEQQVQQNEPPKNCENQNSVMRNVENQEVNLLSKEELCKRIEGVEKELKMMVQVLIIRSFLYNKNRGC